MSRQRSLGTKRVEGVAMRLGVINENEKDIRLRGRPSNIGSRSSMDHGFRYSTPQQSHTPSTSTSSNSHLRVRSIGMQSAFERSSAIGAKKDLNDKSNQYKAEQDIVEFCRLNGYERTEFLQHDGPKRSFPLNSNEFRHLFTFIMQIYEPEFEELEAKTMAENVAAILKDIGYPAHISKQMFQTLGTKHSWANVLAVLQYLINRAKNMILIDDKWKTIGFAFRDEQGFEINDIEPESLIRFDLFVKSYCTWTHGNDDYNEYLDEMEFRLFNKEGLSLRGVEKISSEVRETRKQLQQVQLGTSKVEEEINSMADDCKRKIGDLIGIKDYCNKLEVHNGSKNEEIELIKVKIESLYKEKTSLEKAILDEEKMCVEQRQIDSDEVSSQIQRAIELLEKQKNEEKEWLKTQDNVIWQKERDLAKELKSIDDVCQDFNEKLINLGLYCPNNQAKKAEISVGSEFILIADAPFSKVTEWLQATDARLKKDEGIEREKLGNIIDEINILENELQSKTVTVDQNKSRISKMVKQKNTRENKIIQEESRLKDTLSELKDEVHFEKGKSRGDLDEPREELKNLSDEEEQLKMSLKRVEEHGENLLRDRCTFYLNEKKEAIENFEKMKDDYKKAALLKVDQINAQSAAMESCFATVRDNLEVVKNRNMKNDK